VQIKQKSLSETTSDLRVTIWGSRGTMPCPNYDYLKYGGNTSCIEIQPVTHSGPKNNIKNNVSLIFDAGTGIVPYSKTALKNGIRKFHLFLSHMHYDHIIGLTQFAPLFATNTEINVYGASKCGFSLRQLFEKLFSPPFFPLQFSELPSKNNIFFHEIDSAGCVFVDGCKVNYESLNHPQGALAFRVWDPSESYSLVYATDHEHGTKKDNTLIKFSQNATLLVMDSTYCDELYQNHKGWGHSTAKAVSEIANSAKVENLGLFHHNPDLTDTELENTILKEAAMLYPRAFLCKERHPLSLREISLNQTIFKAK
jgi:phosphoribosyl 1,2-cyclic phosphodiesterase